MSTLTLERSPLISDQRVSWNDFAKRAMRMFLIANCLGILAVAIGFRAWRLGSLPGINGDEAWYGVQAESVLHGEPIAWRTPTGNFLNPFFLLPQLALHAIFPASFTLLRIVPLMSGLLALVVNYWLAWRTFGRQNAVISTLILAVLPINIAYSRFAWDASQSLLFTLPAVYLPLLAVKDQALRWRWTACGFGMLLAAILVHPTNIFVAPMLLIPVATMLRERRPVSSVELEIVRTHERRTTVMLLVSLTAAVIVCKFGWPWIERGLLRCTQPAELLDFVKNYAQLFSGATIYRFVAGSSKGLAPDMFDVVVWSLMACSCYGIFRIFRQQPTKHRTEMLIVRLLGLSWAATIAGFFLIAGPESLRPNFERYGMCLIAPSVLLATCGLQWWLLRKSPAAAIVFLLCGWLTLAGFWIDYVLEIRAAAANSGQMHRTFLTGEIDPKQQAFERILALGDNGNRPIRVVAGDWWCYWPLRYLADSSRTPVEVISLQQVTGQPEAGDQPQLPPLVNAELPLDFVVDFEIEGQSWPSGCAKRLGAHASDLMQFDGPLAIYRLHGRTITACRKNLLESMENN